MLKEKAVFMLKEKAFFMLNELLDVVPSLYLYI